jgi:N-acetylglucosaminyldiphosphoundecaprenol N-acetyl-beta-D-mannosaminyltransferase
MGIAFDNITTSEAIEAIEQMIASRRPHYLVTANVDFLVQARSDIELRRILLAAHLVLCDGTPVLWASRLLGNPLPERVAGADLVPRLLEVAAKKSYRLFFLGATAQSAGRAVARLRLQYPDLIIAGHYSPPFSPLLEMDHEAIKRQVAAAQPDLLLVSFGCPKQEKWIGMHYRALGVPVVVGVGATIDFLAGEVKRAPIWMQRAGLEWVFRLAQEPRRLFRRYVKDLCVFGWCIPMQLWQLQLRSGRPKPSHRVGPPPPGEGSQLIHRPVRIDVASLPDPTLLETQPWPEDRYCLLQMSEVEFVDSTGIALLIRLHKKLRETGRELVLIAPSWCVQRALSLMRLQELLLVAPDASSARQLIESRQRQQPLLVTPARVGSPSPLLWQGELTAANADAAWKCICAHLGTGCPSQEWQIDLSQLAFIDSSGLGLMLRAQKLAAQRDHRLRFINPPPGVRNVVRLGRLEDVLLDEAA